MIEILTYEQIDQEVWRVLVQTSRTGTWFQTPEAYSLYASMPELFRPFVMAVEGVSELSNERTLRGVCVGYVTMEKNAVKQFFTRRTIIIGGPALADDCTNEEVETLMNAVRQRLQIEGCRLKISRGPIYIETRNFNDYSPWREAFEKTGFVYQPHLNFHINTSSIDVVEANLGKSRKRDIKTTIREGVSIVEISQLGLQVSNLEREKLVHEYYLLLKKLYDAKIKTPLFPEPFFQSLAKHPDGRILLTMYNGRVIGGTVCVEQTNKCVYEWFVCGEDGIYNHIFPSSYATYAGICYAAEHHCPRFDMMGAGKPDEVYGVRDFKARFGGKEVEYGRFLCVTKPLLYRLGVIGVKLLKKLK